MALENTGSPPDKRPVLMVTKQFQLRPDDALAIDLSLLRVKPPAAMRDDWHHYAAIGVIPSGEIYPKLRETGCRFSL